jgi:hypothetical protein
MQTTAAMEAMSAWDKKRRWQRQREEPAIGRGEVSGGSRAPRLGACEEIRVFRVEPPEWRLMAAA